MAWFRAPGNPGGSLKVRTASGRIATFETNIVDLLQEVKCSINPIQNGTPWIDSNEVNKEPYIKRAVAGTASRIGNHLYDKLVGGTVAFNQLEVNNASHIQTSQAYNWNNIGSFFSIINGHKYLASLIGTLVSGTIIRLRDSTESLVLPGANSNQIIISAPKSTNGTTFAQGKWDEGTVDAYLNVFDLTQMFGSTIADYVYSLEQATAGAGVAWFKALFPNDYYAYNAGELMSVKATAHVMKNASNTVIGNYALDSNLELRGIPKLDENNKLYYDGDTYESSGAVTRKYGIVDLGELTWSLSSSLFRATVSGIKNPTTNPERAEGIISDIYAPDTAGLIDGKYMADNSMLHDWDTIFIKNTAYNDASVFKTAMEGHQLVYELATPTTEQASPFTNPQVCDENGTEEYTDSRAVAIPVGHETYQANICPISGYTEANITRCGVNLIDLSDLATTGITYSSGDLSGVASAFDTAYDNGYDSGHAFKANTQYTVSMKAYTEGNASTSGNGLRVGFIYTDGTKNYLNITNDTTTETTVSYTSTSGKTVKAIYFTYGSASNNIWHISEFILAKGTTADFTPYNGQTYTIAFGQTVYGGVLDVTRGKLTVTFLEFDLGTLTPVMYTVTEGNLFRYALDDLKPLASNYDVTKMLCSNYPSVASALRANKTLSQVSNLLRFDIIDNDYNDAISMKTAMNGVQVIYPLNTPFDIDLTPEVISAIVGTNNVFAGCGSSTVEYLNKASSGGMETVLDNGQVSTTSSYVTANFDKDVSDLSTLVLRFKYEDNGVPYEVVEVINVSDIPVGGSYQFAFYYIPVIEQLLGTITRTSITLTNYRGAWRDIFVDIKGMDSWQ